MPFSNLLLSVATVGTTTLAFAMATPASAQQYYGHKHYAHARYHHYATSSEGRQIIVHAQEPVVVQTPVYTPGDQSRRSAPSWVEPARPLRDSLPARARLWAVSWAECLAGRRRFSAPRLAMPMALLSPRRSMRPEQWPGRRSRWWAARSERRRPPTSSPTEPLPLYLARIMRSRRCGRMAAPANNQR